MNKKFTKIGLILMLVVAIAFVSGCIGQQPAASTTTWTTQAVKESKTDSGYDVVAGRTYIITTSGRWSCDELYVESCTSLNGNGAGRYDSTTSYPDEVSTIIFLVDNTKVGAGSNVRFTATNNGRLYSIFNDRPGAYYNNEGNLTSKITPV
jgi:hypothetical protein